MKEGHIIILGCKKCGKCVSICPTGALYHVNGEARIDHSKCNLCMQCIDICPNKAIQYLE
jgi:ferredoxin